MSTDESASGATDEVSDQNQDQKPNQNPASGKDDKVSYDTYKKTLSEAKKLKEALKQKDELLQQLEQKKLEAEGNKDELINQLKDKLAKTEKAQKEQFSNFVFQSLDAQVREEALRLGCIDPDAIVKLADMSAVEIDSQTYKADKEQLGQLLEEMKRKKPYLFSKSGPKINSDLPGGVIKKEDKKSYKDMTKDELWAELKKIKGK